MATKPGPLSEFPWEAMGNYKYLLLTPFAAVAALGYDDADNWCFHMCAMAAARFALGQAFLTASRVHAISSKHRIQVTKEGVDSVQAAPYPIARLAPLRSPLFPRTLPRWLCRSARWSSSRWTARRTGMTSSSFRPWS